MEIDSSRLSVKSDFYFAGHGTRSRRLLSNRDDAREDKDDRFVFAGQADANCQVAGKRVDLLMCRIK